jgi:hypothetical protein
VGILVVPILFVLALLMMARPASASSDPKQPTLVRPVGTVSPDYDLGDQSVGSRFSAEACGFAPASGAKILLDERSAGSLIVDAGGCATATISIESNSRSKITQTAIAVPTACGPRSLLASGHNAAGVPVGQAVSFKIVCASSSSPSLVSADRVLRWLFAALVVVIAGGALLIANNRRRVRLEP